jgi:Holliday junction DNA helicase RuvA
MIGRIAGQLVHRGADHVLIDVGGVGYVVHVSEATLTRMPPPGGAVALHTELLVREDLLQLIGFLTPMEKEWHRLLTTVQGVGAKAALGLTGALGADGLARAIALGDWAALRAAPGVGPKLAQRIANELKAKAPALMALAGSMPGAAPSAAPASAPATAAPAAPPPPAAPAPATAEALSALINLGYGQGEAAAAVAEAARDSSDAPTPALIRAALRLLAPKG